MLKSQAFILDLSALSLVYQKSGLKFVFHMSKYGFKNLLGNFIFLLKKTTKNEKQKPKTRIVFLGGPKKA